MNQKTVNRFFASQKNQLLMLYHVERKKVEFDINLFTPDADE